MASAILKKVSFGPGPSHRGPGHGSWHAGPSVAPPPGPLPLVPEEQHEPEDPQFFDTMEEPFNDYGPGRGAMNTAQGEWL